MAEFNDEVTCIPSENSCQKYLLPFNIGDYAYDCLGKKGIVVGIYISDNKVEYKVKFSKPQWYNLSELYTSKGIPCNIEDWEV